MSGNGIISDDLEVATTNMEESECLKDKSNSFRILTFCCVSCFRRRNETNSVQRRGKTKRNKRNEEEGHIGAIPLDKSDKEDQQRKGQDHWSTVSLGEHDHGDAVILAAKPNSMEIQDSLSTVHLDMHHNEQKQEQKLLSAVSLKVHCEEQKRKDRQDYLNNLSLGARCERGKQGGQDHVSAVSEGATTNEEQDYQSVPHKEKQQPMGTEHLSILSLGVTYEKKKTEGQIHVSSQCKGAACKEEQDYHGIPYKEEQEPLEPEHLSNLSPVVTSEKKKREEQDHVSTESEGAPSKEEQDCQGIPHKQEQQSMGPKHPNNLSLDITYEQEKQEGDHVSFESEGAAYKEEQDFQGVSYKEEHQPVGPEHLSNLSPDVASEKKKQEGDHVSFESEGAPSKEKQDCPDVPHKEEQQPMGPKHLNNLFMGITYEEEKQGEDYVSFQSEGAPSKEEQDCQGVPYKEEQQLMGAEHLSILSLGVPYEQEKQEGDHVSSESEGAAYEEEQDCQGVPYRKEQPVGPECLSTWFLGVTYEKEQQVGKDHVSSVSEGASCKEKQYYPGVPHSEQQQVKGPEQLSILSLPGTSEEEQQVRQDHLNTRSLTALYEMDKQVGQNHQSNLFLFVPYGEGKQQDGQNHQNTMPLSVNVSCDSERELWEGQDPQKIMSLYVPCEEEEQQEKQDLVNAMIPCVPCDKGKQQEGQNILYTIYEKEMKQQDGRQDQLRPMSLCVACKENEKEEEEQDLLNTTFLYEP